MKYGPDLVAHKEFTGFKEIEDIVIPLQIESYGPLQFFEQDSPLKDLLNNINQARSEYPELPLVDNEWHAGTHTAMASLNRSLQGMGNLVSDITYSLVYAEEWPALYAELELFFEAIIDATNSLTVRKFLFGNE